MYWLSPAYMWPFYLPYCISCYSFESQEIWENHTVCPHPSCNLDLQYGYRIIGLSGTGCDYVFIYHHR